MSYIGEQFYFAREMWKREYREELGSMQAFDAGLMAGFEIALRAYGIWKDGSQRIGASETPIKDILEALAKEKP